MNEMDNQLDTESNQNDVSLRMNDEENAKQTIVLQGTDASNTYNIVGKNVEIVANKDQGDQLRINASNKIKVNRIVSYEWEQRYTNGNLIAVSKGGKYFAYAIRLQNAGKVRIFYKKMNESTLLKSFKGRVVDLAFAYQDEPDDVYLGIVDETGSLQVFKIFLDADNKIQTECVLHIAGLNRGSSSVSGGVEASQSSTTVSQPTIVPKLSSSTKSLSVGNSSPSPGPTPTEPATHRLTWCVFVAEPEKTDASPEARVTDPVVSELLRNRHKVFLLARKNRVDVFHLGLIEHFYGREFLNENGQPRPVDVDEITVGHFSITGEPNFNILTACISPDGSALACANTNGQVSFFTFNFAYQVLKRMGVESVGDNEKDYNYLREVWYPHGNRPITSLYFLDDHKLPKNDSEFWGILVTGCDYNRELKLWDCNGFNCLQKLRFTSESSGKNTNPPLFKMAIDLSSKYLIMSDITRKCFYVLHFFVNLERTFANCVSISEFNLAYPAISFAVIDTQLIQTKRFNQLNGLNNKKKLNLDPNESINYENGSLVSDANTSQNMTLGAGDLLNLSSFSITNSASMNQMTNAGSSIGIADSTSTLIDQDINSFITMVRLYCIQTKQLQEMQIFLTANEHQLSLLNTSSTANNAPSPTPVTSSVSEPIVTPSAFVSLPHNNSSNTHLPSQPIMPQMLSSSNKINKSINLAELFGHQSTTSDQEKQNQSGLPLKSKKSMPSAFSKLEDSAILHVNTQLAPHHQPILMTPDAFISSPNGLNKQRFSASGTLDLSNAETLNNESLDAKPVTSIDLLQTLINSHNSQSVTVSQSLNLTSSRASSLTQVTAPTNTIAPTTSILPANNKSKQLNKKSNKIRSNRSTTQSSSTSTDNSDTSDSSSSEFDAEDQEIAILSSKAAGATRNGKKSGRNGQQTQTQPKQYQILKRSVEVEHEHKKEKNGDDLSGSKSFNLESPAAYNVSSSVDTHQQNVSNQWPNPPVANIDSALIGETSSKNEALNLATVSTDLTHLLQQMTQSLKAQQLEIESLKKQQLASQSQFKTQLDNSLKQFLHQQQKLNQSILKNSSSSLPSGDGGSLPDDFQNKLAFRLEKTIKDEINKQMQTAVIQRLLDPLREQLSRDLAEKMKSVEGVFRDNVNKLFKSKSTLDAVAQAVSVPMKETVASSYTNTFNRIVPQFEKIVQNMYVQVSQAFNTGIQDYLEKLDQCTLQQIKMFEQGKEPVLNQMRQYSDQMQQNSKQTAADMALSLQHHFDSQIRSSNAILQDTLISSMKAIIKEEIQLAMRDQQHTLTDRLINQMIRQSGTMTPINLPNSSAHLLPGSSLGHTAATTPTQVDTKQIIQNYLQKNQLNNAFQVALCASDLSLLMNVCEQVNPIQAFEPMITSSGKKTQCQLLPPVILSLIQQLCQDLSSQTDLKLRYIEEALVNLDTNSQVAREHLPSVINQLVHKLNQFLKSKPNDKLNGAKIRMLLMASQSLLNQPRSSTLTTESL